MMKCLSSYSMLLTMFLLASSVLGADWTGFRGSNGLGISEDKGLLTKWTSTENIVWRTKLPGPGASSPITLGDRIYLTSYSGYGLAPNEGDMKDLRRHVLCLNRTSGKILWDRQFEPRLRESKYAGGNSSRHGYSSSTPTTDGQRLYVFFGKSGLYCLDLDGKQLWNTTVGSDTHGWGSSNSPVLFQNLVIVNASVESKSLVALNKITGEEVWRTENIRRSWNTPLLVDVPNGKTELVVSETETVLGFDPRSGEELWRVKGFGGYVCPSVVAHDGVVYIVRSNSLAIRAGGRGDVTDTHVLWRGRGRSVVPSPIYHDGHLYWIARGTAVCLNAKSGELVFQERLGPDTGVVYSSVIAADDKLYCASQHNGTYVLAAKPEFQLLSHNVFDDDNSRTNSSPIVSRGQLLMRTDRFLYCIGTK